VPAPTPSGAAVQRLDIRPDETRHSAIVSGRLSLSDKVELFGDGLYTWKRDRASYSLLIVPGFSFSRDTDVRSEQYSLSGGARIALADSWQLRTTVNTGAVENEEKYFQPALTTRHARAINSGASAVADGSI